ncbi:hypothetical protein SNE40_010167 [Patella caerulea]
MLKFAIVCAAIAFVAGQSTTIANTDSPTTMVSMANTNSPTTMVKTDSPTTMVNMANTDSPTTMANTDSPTTMAKTDGPTGHTKHPHPTHAPHIDETFHFFNDKTNNKMAIKTKTACYVFTLTPDQQKALATPAGIQATELALIGMISTGTQTPLTHKDLQHLHHDVTKHCGHNNVIVISQ